MTDEPFGFKSPQTAMRLRQVMKALTQDEIAKAGSNPQVARVMSVDLGKMRAIVWFPGDPDPIEVRMFSNTIPNDIGDERFVEGIVQTSAIGPGSLVMVEIIRSQPYITRVLSGGSFSYDSQVAGITHQTFQAAEVAAGEYIVPPVYGQYQKVVNFFVDALSTTTGKAMMIGPFAGFPDSGSLSGTFRIVITYAGQWARTFEFTIEDAQLSEVVSGVRETRWMRVLPSHAVTWSAGYDLEVVLDIGVRDTKFRSSAGEIWLRFQTLTPSDYVDYLNCSVESYGSVFTFGNPKTGRLVAEESAAPEAIAGYLGFHDSGAAQNNRQDAALGTEPHDGGGQWQTGPWRDGALRVANDLSWVWSTTGHFTWTGTHLKWSKELIFSGIGPSFHGLWTGRLNVPFPTVGDLIQILPGHWTGAGTSAAAVTANGIPMDLGDTLYFGVPPSIGNGGTPGQTTWADTDKCFFIVDNESYVATDRTFNLPEWAIPIARRGYSLNEVENIRITNHSAHAAKYDQTAIKEIISTASASALALVTELVLQSIPSMVFKDGCAYKITAGHRLSMSTLGGRVLFRLRKGTTAAGADWGEFGRTTCATAADVYAAVTGDIILTNNSGADITTQVSITGTAANTAGTWIDWASATTPRFLRSEYIGAAAKYPGALNIT